MARDRNVTVWQAYVVVMSIVSFLCLGTLAFMMFTSGTNSKVAEAAQKDKREAETQLRNASSRNQLLQSMLGIGTPLTSAEVTQSKSTKHLRNTRIT
jgi:type II secretory pathway pseudopilin PulG